jgi:hypothetical protein
VYGFRVPLLVVSEYTPAATISGKVTSYPPTYPPPQLYTHDFGSILAFIEDNFSKQGLGPIAPQGYSYADQNSLDASAPGCPPPQSGGCVPLWDFFLGPTRSFTPISLVNSEDTPAFFQNYYTNQGATPTGPDEGADDN